MPATKTGSGFYAPKGVNDIVNETDIIWLDSDQVIPKGYVHVPEAHADYLGAWLVYLLNRNIPNLDGYCFDDRKNITAVAPGPYEGPDKMLYWLWIKIKIGDKFSTIYIGEDTLSEAIDYNKNKSSITYDINKLNSIVFDLKKLKSGDYRMLCNNSHYVIKRI